jgi:hypothetical protein
MALIHWESIAQRCQVRRCHCLPVHNERGLARACAGSTWPYINSLNNYTSVGCPGFWSLACGLGAGAFEALSLTAPTDRVKVLGQAMSAEKGKPITARQLVAERGFGTLYQGALATTMRQGSSVAVRFFCFDKIKAGMAKSLGHKDINDAPSWVSFLAGGTGGAISVCLNNPIDVAKSKIQAGLYTR